MKGSKLCKLLRTEPVKERAGWNTAQEKKPEKVANKRTHPREKRIEKEEEATRRERSHKKHEKGENDIKEEQVEKGLRTSPHKSAQK